MEGGGRPGYASQVRCANWDELPKSNNGGSTEGDDDPAKKQNTTAGKEESINGMAREQEHLLMPITNISRIMRKVLPTHAKIGDGTKETVQRCLLDFIGRVTAVANECCHKEQRKTVTTDDVLCALGMLGLDEYVEYLSLYLNRHRSLDDDVHRPARRDLLSQASRGTAAAASTFWTYPAAPRGLGMGSPSFGTARFFTGEGAGSTAAADADGRGLVVMPQGYGRDVDAAASHLGLPQPFGFDPFARYD